MLSKAFEGFGKPPKAVESFRRVEGFRKLPNAIERFRKLAKAIGGPSKSKQKRAKASKRKPTQKQAKANNWSQMVVALEIQAETSKTSKDKQ